MPLRLCGEKKHAEGVALTTFSRYQFLQAPHPHRVIIEAFYELYLLSTVFFENVLILNTDFDDGLQAIGCKGGREHEYLLHPAFCTVTHNLVREWR